MKNILYYTIRSPVLDRNSSHTKHSNTGQLKNSQHFEFGKEITTIVHYTSRYNLIVTEIRMMEVLITTLVTVPATFH